MQNILSIPGKLLLYRPNVIRAELELCLVAARMFLFFFTVK